MDVTFSENEPFYPKSSIQVETDKIESPWEPNLLAFPQLEPLENTIHTRNNPTTKSSTQHPQPAAICLL